MPSISYTFISGKSKKDKREHKDTFMTHFLTVFKKVNRRGFSMVEVITATVIVSVLAAGIFATTSFSKRMDVTVQQKLIAMSKVEEQMNNLKQQGVAALPPVTTASTGDPCPSFAHPACRSNLCTCV